MAPSRASAERRGVKVPKWRGVSPTTIIAKTGFKFPSPRLNGILPAFWPHPDIILARFFRKRKPACQTRERSGTLSKSKQRCWHSMLDTPSNTSSDIRLQSFSIAYEYPVAFTRDAFNPANRCLIDALARKEAGKLHRCAVFVDEGVLSAMPELEDRISDYASFHANR